MRRPAARPRPPLFLARAPYRRRRLEDVARILPLVGVLAFILPVLWSGRGGMRSLSADVAWYFLIWLALVGGAAVLSRALTTAHASDQD